MLSSIFRIVGKTVIYYRKSILYQILIITLLSSVITGSLLTGWSVRSSLKKSSVEKLGRTGIMISSGKRYFSSDLAGRMNDNAGIRSTGILEIKGYCQNLNSQKGAFNTNIYALNSDYFKFQGNNSVKIKPGEVLINRKLADYLEVSPGDQLIIKFSQISDIPADAPFAPEQKEQSSVVVKIGAIIDPYSGGNFSLAISQVVSINVFMNLSDIETYSGEPLKINRLLVDRESGYSISQIRSTLMKLLKPSDIGLKLREVKAAGEIELTSDRVFIDRQLEEAINKLNPHSAPVITYLGNRYSSNSRYTPYSFISALPSSLYPEIPSGDSITINKWMAEDLRAAEGDSLLIYWYSPDSLNKLKEDKHKFIIGKIVDMKGIWSDSLLMPDFPGISGSKTCSEWDAGIPVKMSDIRNKDEDYWNKYRGTPKAFISYEKGSELWGNNFGPATAIRFPKKVTRIEIEASLNGKLDPAIAGFTINDLYGESLTAADESVDFGTLFISLGFFLIVAAIVLLSFAVSSYFDSKRGQIFTLFAIGFNNRLIEKILFLESAMVGLAGSLTGAFTGILVNIAITAALNSVWKGAVQTDTLYSFINMQPILAGFVITFVITMVFILIKIRGFQKKLNRKEKVSISVPSPHINLVLAVTLSILTISSIAISFIYPGKEMVLFFVAGTLLLATLIIIWRQFYIKPVTTINFKNLSRTYYSVNSSQAVSPILFIAAGIFAVFIAGANKMDTDNENSDRKSGTGGYLLWCESTLPIREDMNSLSGKKALGIDDEPLSELRFVMMKRSEGNDASCLNLNHVTSPPLLGVDPADFIKNGSFTFAGHLSFENNINPWTFLTLTAGPSTIYGIADQTVLDWGLKISVGDTLILRAENGQPLNIIIAGGLKSSVFQGHVLIGKENFAHYYPSVSGSSVILAEGNRQMTDTLKSGLNESLGNYGIHIENTTDRLNSFNQVTNTYLSVFGMFGVFGLITGIAGLGFVLLRTYNLRKREFALMTAIGFSFRSIRVMIFKEQTIILFAGVTSGILSAILATLPSLLNNQNIPWVFIAIMVAGIVSTGLTVLIISVRSVSKDSLVLALKKE